MFQESIESGLLVAVAQRSQQDAARFVTGRGKPRGGQPLAGSTHPKMARGSGESIEDNATK